MLLTDFSADAIHCVLRFASASDLARVRGTCSALKLQAEDEELWEKHCGAAGLSRNGSARPKSRTYCSWRQTWLDGRCVECGDTYMFKINLDGGSSSASLWHGAKVAVCPHCACTAVFCYKSATSTMAEVFFPNLSATYMPEGWMIVRICGRNVEAQLQGAGIRYEKWLKEWSAHGRETARASRTRLAVEKAVWAAGAGEGLASASSPRKRASAT